MRYPWGDQNSNYNKEKKGINGVFRYGMAHENNETNETDDTNNKKKGMDSKASATKSKECEKPINQPGI